MKLWFISSFSASRVLLPFKKPQQCQIINFIQQVLTLKKPFHQWTAFNDSSPQSIWSRAQYHPPPSWLLNVFHKAAELISERMSDLDFIVCKLCRLHSDWPSHTVRSADFAPGLHAHTHEMWSLYNKLHLDFQRQDWFPALPLEPQVLFVPQKSAVFNIECSALCTDVL